MLTDVTVELAPGELVVLYTDGVTEVRAAPARGLRIPRARRVLATLQRACPPDAVAERVEQAVLDAAGGRPRDDIAILVVGPSPADAGMLPGAIEEDTDG